MWIPYLAVGFFHICIYIITSGSYSGLSEKCSKRLVYVSYNQFIQVQTLGDQLQLRRFLF